MSRRALLSLAVAVAVLAAACSRPAAAPAPPARRVEVAVEERAPKAAAGRVSVVCDEAALPAVLGLIDGAREEVEIVVFEGTAWPNDPSREIAEAIRRAVGRGVRVRALLDDGPEGNRHLAGLLAEAGVDVSLDGPDVRTHCKMVVADRRAALVGSTNWSGAAFRWNREANVLIENPASAAYLDEYVEALHDSGGERYGRPGPEPPEAIPLVDGALAEAHGRVIRGARGRLDVVIHATSEGRRRGAGGPLDLLIEAAERGVRVRVILERSDREKASFVNDLNEEAAALLRAGGVEVRWDDPRRTTHAKVVLADSEAIVSSANWTASSLRDGHEAGALVRDPAALADLRAYFDRLWAGAAAN